MVRNRKSPIKHEVKKHSRGEGIVKKYTRGSGVRRTTRKVGVRKRRVLNDKERNEYRSRKSRSESNSEAAPLGI